MPNSKWHRYSKSLEQEIELKPMQDRVRLFLFTRERRNEMSKILATICISLFLVVIYSVNASSQPKAKFDIGFTYAGESENEDSLIDTEIQRTLVWLSGSAPIAIGNGHHLILGVEYKGQLVEYDDFRPVLFPPIVGGNLITEDDLPEDLHALDVSIGLLWSWSEAWSTLFQFKPGIHSDFEDIDGDDLMFTGTVLAQRKFGTRNRFGLGITYSDSFGEPEVFPLGLLDWYPTEKWYVEALLPLNVDVGYKISQSISAGVEGKLQGYQYRLTEDRPWDESVLNYREVRIGPFLDATLWGNTHLRLSAGLVTAQEFEVRDEDNDDEIVDGDYENTAYATIKLYISF